jgi:RNA polymerase sigma factor (sigma-70 family)
MKRIEGSSCEDIACGTVSSRDGQALTAFEELAMPLSRSLYKFAHWLVQNGQDAEDLVQESYLKALRSFDSFEPGTDFRSWIFKILKNTFMTLRTKKEWHMTIPLDSEETLWKQVDTFDTPESVLIARFDVDAIRNAIEQLPLIHREVILLFDIEDTSYKEIAERLSIPIGTVMSRLSRARKIVRKSLRSEPYPLAREPCLMSSKRTRKVPELRK